MRGPRVYASALDTDTSQNNYINNLNPKRAGMRVPREYGSASDIYTWHNNYLNNS